MAQNETEKTRPATQEKEQLTREREAVLERVNAWLDPGMVVLGFVWLVLLIVGMTQGLSPFLQMTSNLIWGLFILDFLVEFILAPQKLRYLEKNWLTALSLAVPALRVLRAFRALRVLRYARVARTARLLSIFGSVNRGMTTLGTIMGRRGVAYVMALTLIVTFAGAAGMYFFEKDAASGQGFRDYGTAVWWTAMVMTTMGSQYWPETGEGKMLCLLLATYAFAVFGYVTATIATVFIGLDNTRQEDVSPHEEEIRRLRREVESLKDEIHELSAKRP